MVKVKILIPGEYMDTNLRVQTYQAGEILDTKAWYADWLISSEQAEMMGAADPAQVKKPHGKKEKPVAVKTENPFL